LARGDPVVQDLVDVLDYRGRYRAFPGALTGGMKPPQFAVWMLEQLGASRGDDLDDLPPGSGAVPEAWLRYVAVDVEARAEQLADVELAAGG
jgi:hypothetical protein